ncbi:neprosin family prolyl endopeptidase [Paraburkholderia caribensis]|uniref:neprosin family prolyl endopeptidase n=1 Tax=Paraburkholderia caribensis TaxID=75105 RepID=UPI0031E1CFAA
MHARMLAGLLTRRIAMMAITILLASCTASHTTNDGDVSFRTFLSSLGKAQFSDYSGKPGVRVVDDASFQRMKSYLLERYRDVHVTHSFVDSGNVFVDCIPILEQPSMKRLRSDQRAIDRKPPPILDAPRPSKTAPNSQRFSERRFIDITLKEGALDVDGNERFCRGDTIPVRRILLDDLVRFPTLEAFFRKGERVEKDRIPGDSQQHYYARGVQFVDNYGADSWLNVWSPSVADHEMSLSQLWVVGNTGDQKQTVEAGWQVYPNRWNSSNSALFIYYTTGGYKDGTGCYNVDCDGFVQIARNIYLGSGFDHYSARDQTQWGFELQYKRNTDGNWWLFYRGGGDWIAVGYYPKALFGDGTLSVKADKVAFGGEDTGSLSAKQMGSGERALGQFGKAAYQNTAFYIDTRVVSQWASLSPEIPDPSCYTATINNIFGDWGTYLYFGGPSCN